MSPPLVIKGSRHKRSALVFRPARHTLDALGSEYSRRAGGRRGQPARDNPCQRDMEMAAKRSRMEGRLHLDTRLRRELQNLELHRPNDVGWRNLCHARGRLRRHGSDARGRPRSDCRQSDKDMRAGLPMRGYLALHALLLPPPRPRQIRSLTDSRASATCFPPLSQLALSQPPRDLYPPLSGSRYSSYRPAAGGSMPFPSSSHLQYFKDSYFYPGRSTTVIFFRSYGLFFFSFV